MRKQGNLTKFASFRMVCKSNDRREIPSTRTYYILLNTGSNTGDDNIINPTLVRHCLDMKKSAD